MPAETLGGAVTLRSEIQSELDSGHPAPKPLQCSFQRERGGREAGRTVAKSGSAVAPTPACLN